MRIGQVVRIFPDKKFGFIATDNLREDIFFHFSVVVPEARPLDWEPGQEVEFEIDELKRMEGEELRATLVQVATRPISVKIAENSQNVFSHKHHPRARQRKPGWRRRGSEE